MKEQLITFETAKLAKEKGFAICTTNCYDYRDYNNKIHPELWKTEYRNFGVEMIFAPTQSLLQKWLRDVYYCHVWVEPFYNDGWHYLCHVSMSDGYYYKFYPEDDLDAWVDLLEKGLQKALKLIP